MFCKKISLTNLFASSPTQRMKTFFLSKRYQYNSVAYSFSTLQRHFPMMHENLLLHGKKVSQGNVKEEKSSLNWKVHFSLTSFSRSNWFFLKHQNKAKDETLRSKTFNSGVLFQSVQEVLSKVDGIEKRTVRQCFLSGSQVQTLKV